MCISCFTAHGNFVCTFITNPSEEYYKFDVPIYGINLNKRHIHSIRSFSALFKINLLYEYSVLIGKHICLIFTQHKRKVCQSCALG